MNSAGQSLGRVQIRSRTIRDHPFPQKRAGWPHELTLVHEAKAPARRNADGLEARAMRPGPLRRHATECARDVLAKVGPMAPWDPVRDAALASSGTVQKRSTIPRNRSWTPPPPLPSGTTRTRATSSTTPTRAPTLLIPTATTSPTNSTHGGGQNTPRTTSSLAMLLNDTTTYRSSPSPSTSSRPTLPFGHHHGQHSATASGSSSTSAVPLDLLMNPVSPTRRPLKVDQSPTLQRRTTPAAPPPAKRKVSSPPPPPPPKPVRPPGVLYNPVRITPEGNVRKPLTAEERRRFERPDNSLRRAMTLKTGKQRTAAANDSRPSSSQHKALVVNGGGYSPSQPQGSEPMDYELQRKRKRMEEEDADLDAREAKRPHDGDVKLVANHYNKLEQVGVEARAQSAIFGLKAFNNWIKSVLIQKMAHEPLARSRSVRSNPPPPPRSGSNAMRRPSRIAGRVLDIGCGKGGDLKKWLKAKVKEYIGLDLAGVSVEQARTRWMQIRGNDRFDAWFGQLDCYREAIGARVPRQYLEEPFDVVTMQFCMHYAFETEQMVRTMLDNVSRYLRPGGRFVGTIPNAAVLRTHLEYARQDDPNALSFGNSVYRVVFDSFDGPLYGHRYHFKLEEAVDNVPEYVVYWDNFVAVAEQYGLRPIYKEEFHDIYQQEESHPEFGELLRFMKVVDENNTSAMDVDQWEAANIYIAFAFEKVATG